MDGNYLIIDKRVLPEVYEKVADVKALLRSGKVKEITEATQKIGISRSAYYKYKDFIFDFADSNIGKKCTYSLTLSHKKGALSRILNLVAEKGGNIITIDQTVPVNGIAIVTISIDISSLEGDAVNMLEYLSNMDFVEKAEIITME